MIYTHEMFERYIDNGNANEEAFNYSETSMNIEEIRADIEECLKDYEFEVEEDREEYINAILSAVDNQRTCEGG